MKTQSFKDFLAESSLLRFKKEGDHYRAKTNGGDFTIINNTAADNGKSGWSLYLISDSGEMEPLEVSKRKRDLVSYANEYAKDNNLR